MIKVAFIGFPAVGGNYTHFCYLKEGLTNVEMNLIGLGEHSGDLLPDNRFIHLGKTLYKKSNAKELAKLFIDFITNEHYDLVIPMNSPIVVSVIPFLPSTCKVVQIVNSDTPRVYKYVTSYLDSIHHIVCISKKQEAEIKTRTGIDFFMHHVSLIPHGVHTEQDEIKVNVPEKLQLGYIGRMHQGHKNIFLLPEILKKLTCPYSFEFIGEGPDKEALVQRLTTAGINYHSLGEIKRNEIHSYVKKWDIQLFPSTVEGFGLTLIECMNSGVVPLSNELKGITDYIITHQNDGFIIKQNDLNEYVRLIELLNNDRVLLTSMKEQAQETVKERFNLELILLQYQQLFQEVYETPKVKEALHFSEWKPYVEYKPSLLKRIVTRIFK